MPAKNAGKHITECLSSIQRQAFSFWELIIVNDGSSDDTESIIQAFISRDSRIQLLDNKEVGIIPALETAFEHAKGEFITRMDADDIMPEGRLELMVDALTSSDSKTVVTGKVKYFGTEAISEGYQKYESWLNHRIDQDDHWKWVYRECVIASPNWMVRKSDLESIGGFSNLSYPEDYDLVLRWYQNRFRVLGSDEITLLWREHDERTSRNSVHYSQEHFFQLKVGHFLKHELRQSHLALWGSGVKGKLTADILKQKEMPFTWMDINPTPTQPTIKPYQCIEELEDVKLLISVYPEETQMKALREYLTNLGLSMGTDYWFL